MTQKKQDKSTFSAEERAAMQARAKELKDEAKRASSREEGEQALLAALKEMPQPSQRVGRRIHELVSRHAPYLMPKTWYGMPAYANADGKVVCFYRGADKFKERYMTFGFNDVARIDDGKMWPIAFAITDLGPEEEKRLASLIEAAVK